MSCLHVPPRQRAHPEAIHRDRKVCCQDTDEMNGLDLHDLKVEWQETADYRQDDINVVV
jgi:hypothetical protein